MTCATLDGEVMIEIDGSRGEGGGQILRSALTLSIATGKAMRIHHIRARRTKPGLRAQHLRAVEAASKIARAEVEGAQLGSSAVEFTPGKAETGRYFFDVVTAGATSLVFQTICLPLSFAEASSEIIIVGGTHVRWSPCYHYLAMQWDHYMHRMGYRVDLELEKAGFYPQGGGRLRAVIQPVDTISPLHLMARGELRCIRGVSAACNLPQHIAERQRMRAIERLKGLGCEIVIEIQKTPAHNKGSFLILLAEFEHGRACYFGLGERGLPAERVADSAVDQLLSFLRGDGCVDEYLADQLLLPLSFATDNSAFKTSKVTRHLLTNAEVIRAFTTTRIEILGEAGDSGEVHINPGS